MEKLQVVKIDRRSTSPRPPVVYMNTNEIKEIKNKLKIDVYDTYEYKNIPPPIRRKNCMFFYDGNALNGMT
jgi:hypothetical protein